MINARVKSGLHVSKIVQDVSKFASEDLTLSMKLSSPGRIVRFRRAIE